MPKIEVELGSESTPICSCCGSTTHVLRGFVKKDGEAYGAYIAGYTEKNPKHFGTMVVSIGDWSERSTPADRKAILVLVRKVDGKAQFMVGGAKDNRYGDIHAMGRLMERGEALGDPRIDEFWHVTDHIWAADDRLAKYFEQP